MEHPTEMIIGIVVFGFILLLALIGSSSDRDERRYSRDGNRRGRGGGYGRYPEYDREGRYGRDQDDYWEDDYDRRGDYYRRGRGRRRRRGGVGISGLIVAFFLGIIVFIALIQGDGNVFNKEIAPETKLIPQIYGGMNSGDIPLLQTPKQGPNPVHVSELDTEEYSPTQMEEHSDPVPVSAAPEWEYLNLQNKPFCIRLALTDTTHAKYLSEVYAHRNVEIFKDDNDRCWVLIFIRNSQEMAETVEILQLRQEDLINHGCNIVQLRTSTLCTGQLKRIKGTNLWFCAE